MVFQIELNILNIFKDKSKYSFKKEDFHDSMKKLLCMFPFLYIVDHKATRNDENMDEEYLLFEMNEGWSVSYDKNIHFENIDCPYGTLDSLEPDQLLDSLEVSDTHFDCLTLSNPITDNVVENGLYLESDNVMENGLYLESNNVVDQLTDEYRRWVIYS